MTATLSAHNFLTRNGTILIGDSSYRVEAHKFRFHSAEKTARKLKMPYFVESVPIEVHFHGIGQIDFSGNVDNLDLTTIQKLLSEEGVMGIPTIFLEKSKLKCFLDLMQRFSVLKQNGKLENILGLALEGPVLLSRGGTPKEGSWIPTRKQWKDIAACGEKGLKYMVISPDWDLSKLLPVAELFLSNGIYLSLGHCRRDFVKAAVEGINAVTDLATKIGFKPYSGAISVDHLFNDMPRNIKHAWRTVSERRMRSQQLIDMDIDKWNFGSLESQIGEVPATMIKLAVNGLITLFLNFDSYHVDLQICRRVYEMVGTAGITAMTDRMESSAFGKWHLKKAEIGTLWYQESGSVAVGSSTLDEQMINMRSLMIPEKDIWKICALNPAQIFMHNKLSRKKTDYLSYVDKRSLRIGIETQMT